MLPPNYLEGLESQISSIYSDLEINIIQEISKRILNVGYANTVVKNNMIIAQQAGMLYTDIVNLVAQNTQKSYGEIEKIFTDAGIKTIKLDDEIYKKHGLNPITIRQDKSMLDFLNATIKQTGRNLNNLVRTTADTSQQNFINKMNDAYLQVSTGAKSYSQAIIDAIDSFAGESNKVVYPSGYTTSLENATRMNIYTGVNSNCGRMQLMRAQEMGCNLMEISAHGGARPEHAEWQGKIVDITGKNKKYLTLNDIGYGTATGFQGVNCRHTWFPYYEGEVSTYSNLDLTQLKNEKVMYNGQRISKYAASQIQRKMERAIRNDKKNIAGLQVVLTSNNSDDKLIKEARNKLKQKQILLQEHNNQLKDLITQINAKIDYSRLKVVKNIKKIPSNIPNNISEFYEYYRNKTNKILTPNTLNEILGYNELPTLVPKEKFEEMAKQNKYGILERGFKTGRGTLSIKQISENYKRGDFYVGEGIFGSGTYTHYGKDAHKRALNYAIDNNNLSAEKNIIQYMIKDDAKIGKYTELKKMRDKELDEFIKKNNFKDYTDVLDNGLKNIKTTEIYKYIMELQDMGVYASIKGYDAIDTIYENAGRDENRYLVILNRKKMVMYD